jgi:hypothetical protein
MAPDEAISSMQRGLTADTRALCWRRWVVN